MFLWVLGSLGFSFLSVFLVLFSSFWCSLVYFLCTRVAPLYVFDIYNITYQNFKENKGMGSASETKSNSKPTTLDSKEGEAIAGSGGPSAKQGKPLSPCWKTASNAPSTPKKSFPPLNNASGKSGNESTD
jgi:hypothetical protein